MDKRWETPPEMIAELAKDGYRPTGLYRALDPDDRLLAETSRPKDFDELNLPEDTIFLQQFKKEDFVWSWTLPDLVVGEEKQE